MLFDSNRSTRIRLRSVKFYSSLRLFFIFYILIIFLKKKWLSGVKIEPINLLPLSRVEI